jgi:uncharacterized protein (DUF1778 family)
LHLYAQWVYTVCVQMEICASRAITGRKETSKMQNVLEKPHKEERVHARLRHDEKQLLELAANCTGLSMSRFMLTSALREARKVIRQQKTTLTPQEAAAFGEMLLNPPAPDPAAIASLRKARR